MQAGQREQHAHILNDALSIGIGLKRTQGGSNESHTERFGMGHSIGYGFQR
jgi:hypothetical protein